jgi:hypothetical protein
MDWKSKRVEAILAALAEDKVANDSPNGSNGRAGASGHDGNSPTTRRSSHSSVLSEKPVAPL